MKDIVLLSTADWDNPFWTNKQHVAVQLAKRGYRVFYIDSLGLRRPSCKREDLGRIFSRIKRFFRLPRQVQENIWVGSPFVFPWQQYKVVRVINAFLFSYVLKFFLKWLRFRADIVWTYNPLTLQFIQPKSFGQLVYHCVDEISAQPGMPADVIREFEKVLVERADIVFVTSKALFETRRLLNKNTYYFPNVVDYTHFSRALDATTVIPEDLSSLKKPIVGFVGALSAYKVDFSLLYYVANMRPKWSFVLIGKVGEGDPWTEIGALKKLPNVHFLGPKAYSALPAYLKGFDIAILPCVRNEYTKSMFPMKFFEYLAAGLGVVATDLPALDEFKSLFYGASSNEDFLKGIEHILNGEGASLNERLEAARQHTYESRTDKMLALL